MVPSIEQFWYLWCAFLACYDYYLYKVEFPKDDSRNISFLDIMIVAWNIVQDKTVDIKGTFSVWLPDRDAA